VFDAYTRRARLAPAALAGLPGLVLAGASVSGLGEDGSIIGLVVGAGGLVLCGIVRGAGLRMQPELWKAWGGPPTTQRLRWRGSDAAIVQRRHQKVEAITGEPLPTHEEEKVDALAADLRYADAVEVLRERTRDATRFPTVAAENAEYGFRRNCLGIRRYAISVAVAAVAVGVGQIAVAGAPGRWLSIVVGGVAALAWWRLVTANWVRSAAELYADRLIEASAGLSSG
jgi:hypothetical protein